MSRRLLLRSWLLGLVAVISLTAAAPAIASPQSTQLTPCSSCTPSSSTFVAGSNSSYTTTINFDSSEGLPQTVSAQLASGLLANLSSSTALSCITSSSDSSSCIVGGGTITTTVGSFPFTAFLVAPSAGNVIGIDFAATTTPASVLHAEVALQQPTSGGPVVAVETIPLSGLPPTDADVTQTVFNLNSTLPDGSPFTRMPSACTPAIPTSVTVAYLLGTETTSASPDVNVSSTCGSLPFNPQVSGSATRDGGDTGTQVVTQETQTAAEAAISSTTLLLPPNVVQPNTGAVALANSTTPVGSVTATSPLLPSAIPLTGSVFFTLSSAGSLGITITFTSPITVSLSGVINSNGSLTVANQPDLPLTSLTVTLFGGANSLFMSSCAAQSGTMNGGFIGQNGASAHPASTFTLSGCPSGGLPAPITTTAPGSAIGSPTLFGVSLSGLRKRHPSLRFTLTHGTNAPNISSLRVKLPSGLSFNRKAIENVRTCKGKGKKRSCTTTVRVSGLSQSGGTLKSAKLSGGKLILSLKKAVASYSAILTSPLLQESKGLQKKVKNGRIKSMHVTLRVTDAHGTATTLTAVVKP